MYQAGLSFKPLQGFPTSESPTPGFAHCLKRHHILRGCLNADCHQLAALQTEESSSDVAAMAAPAASTMAATEQPALLTAAASHSILEAGNPLVATEAPAGDKAVVKAADEGKGLLQHINFWQQDELRLEHPEVQVGACQCVSDACWG